MSQIETGYAPIHGIEMYWEGRGNGGVPLIVTHGGFGMTTMFGDLLDLWAIDRRVVAVELQGHGHTADTDRPFTFENFGDDLAALAEHFGFDQVDLLGYSLGGLTSLKAASRHAELVRKLVLVSVPFRSDGWFPEVRAGMAQVNRSGFEMMKHSPLYSEWAAVAPNLETFPDLMDKEGALVSADFDWTDEVAALQAQTLLVYGDADSISLAHVAEFFALLGGGVKDAGWNMAELGPNRLAVLPKLTHYDIASKPELGTVVSSFLQG